MIDVLLMGYFFRVERSGLQAVPFSTREGQVSTGSPVQFAATQKLSIKKVILSPSASMLVAVADGATSPTSRLIEWNLRRGSSSPKIVDTHFLVSDEQWADDHTLILSGYSSNGAATRDRLIATSFNVETSRFSGLTRIFPGEPLVDEVRFADALKISRKLEKLGLKPIQHEFQRITRAGVVGDPGVPHLGFRPRDFIKEHIQWESFVTNAESPVAVIGELKGERGLWCMYGSQLWLMEARVTRLYDGWSKDGYLGIVCSNGSGPRHLSIYDVRAEKLIFTAFADYSGITSAGEQTTDRYDRGILQG